MADLFSHESIPAGEQGGGSAPALRILPHEVQDQPKSEEGGEWEERIWVILREIPDPELPAISIVDLGIVRQIVILNVATTEPPVSGVVASGERGDISIEVVITPTYMGCPAIDIIQETIIKRLLSEAYPAPRIRLQLYPAWSTDWISAHGRSQMMAFGIVPPLPRPSDKEYQTAEPLSIVPRPSQQVLRYYPRSSERSSAPASVVGLTVKEAEIPVVSSGIIEEPSIPETIVRDKHPSPSCPRCGHHATLELSRFGATPCKSIHRCTACQEPFEYFKPY